MHPLLAISWGYSNTMSSSLWNQTITSFYCPPWPCPICKAGTFTLIPKSLVKEAHINSIRRQGKADFVPDDIHYSFTAWAQCGNGRCKQKFAIAGDGGINIELEKNGVSTGKTSFGRSCVIQCHASLKFRRSVPMT
jgi:hypothetical protein